MNPEYAARVIADLVDIESVLPNILHAIAHGDFEAAGSYMTEDVILEIRGAARFCGSWHGREDVVGAMRTNYGSVRDQRPVIECSAHTLNTTGLLVREEGYYREDDEPYSIRASIWITYDGRFVNRIEELCVNA